MEMKVLRGVTREFNKYRAPECKAKVLLNKDNTLIVEFTGTKASFACCFDENFVDYHYYLKDLTGLDFKISQIIRKSPEKFVVTYKGGDERRIETEATEMVSSFGVGSEY